MAPTTKRDLYTHARSAYFHGGKTHNEIAKEVGISERTLRNWIKESCWDRLRQNANLAPAVMLEHFCSQMVFIQSTVASRPFDERMPKPHEVEMQRKLLTCMIRMKDYPTDKFQVLAYGINTVSDPEESKEDLPVEEEKKLDFEAPLNSLYTPFEDKETYYSVNKSGNFQYTAGSGNYYADLINYQLAIENGTGIATGNSESEAATLLYEKKKQLSEKVWQNVEEDGQALEDLRCMPPTQPNDEGDILDPYKYVSHQNVQDLCRFTYDNRPTTTGERITIESYNKRIRNELKDMYEHPKIYPIGRFKVYDFRLHAVRDISPQEWNLLLSRDYTQQQLEMALG